MRWRLDSSKSDPRKMYMGMSHKMQTCLAGNQSPGFNVRETRPTRSWSSSVNLRDFHSLFAEFIFIYCARNFQGLGVIGNRDVVICRCLAPSAISEIVADPSLQRVCICRSPRSLFCHPGFVASSRRASASETKSRRILGIFLIDRGGFSIQR
jgi:hypothetical protein